VPHFIDPNALR